MKKKNTAKYLSYLLSLAWMGLIFYFSSQNADLSTDTSNSFTAMMLRFFGITPTIELIETLRSFIRTAAHFGIFGFLGLFYRLSCRLSQKVKSLYLVPVAMTFIYAVTDEIHQLFSDGRAFQASDVIIDTLGAVVFIGVEILIIQIYQKNKKQKEKNRSL
ncbi:MAG: VanZ family protein [Clostridia bacterium]|nr:VanZ family protein [Clostridia bacterium]